MHKAINTRELFLFVAYNRRKFYVFIKLFVKVKIFEDFKDEQLKENCFDYAKYNQSNK